MSLKLWGINRSIVKKINLVDWLPRYKTSETNQVNAHLDWEFLVLIILYLFYVLGTLLEKITYKQNKLIIEGSFLILSRNMREKTHNGIHNTGQQPKLSWNKTSCFHVIFGRWVRIRHPFFSITSEFCSIANFMVARSEN